MAIKSRDERKRHVGELLETAGISPAVADRYPHEFSGAG
jgi:ABC-type oligopeptide transport system ATPase subunit